MQLRKLAFALALVTLMAAPAFADDTALDINKYLTPANIAKMEKGEVVMLDQTYVDGEGKTRGKGLAMAMVNASPDTIWKFLGDFNNYPQFMPRVTSTKTYLSSGSKKGVYFTLKVAFKTVKYNCMHTIDKGTRTVKWELDKSKENDIAETIGAWIIKPQGEKSILCYTVAVDTGMAVPKVIQDYLTKKDLPNVVKAMKSRVESGGTYKK